MNWRIVLLLLLFTACYENEQDVYVQGEQKKVKVHDYSTLEPVSGATVEFEACLKPDLVFRCIEHKIIKSLHTNKDGIVSFSRKLNFSNIIVSKAGFITNYGHDERCRITPNTPPMPEYGIYDVFLLPENNLEFKINNNAADDSTDWVLIDTYYETNDGCKFLYLLGTTPFNWNIPTWDFPLKFKSNRDTTVYRTGVGNMHLKLEIKYYDEDNTHGPRLTHSRILDDLYTPRDKSLLIEISL